MMPNALRAISKGRPMFRLRVMPWSDDVSGNVSKQYNAHTNVYITNLNLPHRALSQEYFVQFCSTSPHASSSEQFTALAEDLYVSLHYCQVSSAYMTINTSAANKWHDAYDCALETEILFQIAPHLFPADNPQQSETASHIGVNGNYNCRRDFVGGTEAEKETDKGYAALYSVSGRLTLDKPYLHSKHSLGHLVLSMEPLRPSVGRSGLHVLRKISKIAMPKPELRIRFHSIGLSC